MKRSITTLLFIMSTPTVLFAQECVPHLSMGQPGESDVVLCREGYAVGYNEQLKVADWVAYYVTKESVNAYSPRTDYFKLDFEIDPPFRASSFDYNHSGYDRGHLAPAGTIDFSKHSVQQSFLMSNIAPQLPGFNRGGWKGLEQYVRDWANVYQSLYVVTGPIWDGEESYIGNGVYIPNRFFKVILDPQMNEAIAFILPHRKISTSELPLFITTVDDVEEATNLNFFNVIPDSIEGDMEQQHWEMW
ncbi:DNA/RNA non-specific endonuclease (plasmid) [Vibrio lentus]|uniref:Endonuclease n=2 Tax=Vibrio TaxID=662 RepID=A0A0H3ZQP2_9VIBR|nr:DNA/RNA non-specific endonuclease [Vibrio lentus]AKN36229.1 DNA/RNA endonuclease G [Vibrio tasmaniensis]AKN37177.1 DNA/RNA endonuclease G [Vibrio genomosp. F6]PMI60752.1 DNA/RNA endonuclease G [Vibrio lentus]